MIRTYLIAGLMVFITGCATQTFTLQGEAGVNAEAEANQEQRQHFFVEGVGQERVTNAAEACGGADKVAAVEVEQNFVDGLLAVITYGIYTPRTARVYCTV